MKDKIDFVITWVDGNDPKWLEERRKYSIESNEKVDNRNIRYRDWSLLKYWFRGVEKFAPWVNHIYFITYGHLPEWLNIENSKLTIVNHKDYIDEKYLPTFNSNTIEANMHEIKGLQEKFVYFNDDMFLTNYVEEKDFFRKGKPCDSLVLAPIIIKPGDGFYKKIANNIEIINTYFDFKNYKKNNKKKLISYKYNKYLLKNIPLMIYDNFIGFQNFHFPISYLKSTFKDVWEKEKNRLETTMNQKFRNNSEGINHWLFQYWQFASGNFIPRNPNIGKYFDINDKKLLEVIKKKKYKITCMNDTDENINFEQKKKELIDSFETILKDKSIFEK